MRVLSFDRRSNTKMSSSDKTSAIFMTDTAEEIKTKVFEYAFSGGRVTAKEHKEKGADLTVVCLYLCPSLCLSRLAPGRDS